MSPDEWYKSLPIITRYYVTLSFLTTAACALEIITPFNVYFNSHLIFKKGEIWRLLTNFFFFGNLGLDFVFHMFFLVKYCKSLEEGSFRGRSADFLWMLLLGGALLTSLAPFVAIEFLGSSLTFMMVYVWGRRHQYVNLSFLGIFNFTAPYLPWVLLAFSVMLGSSPKVDLLGMVAGHAYYFLEDVYPRMTGRRPLKTPGFIQAVFPVDEPIRPAAEEGMQQFAADQLQEQQQQQEQQQPANGEGRLEQELRQMHEEHPAVDGRDYWAEAHGARPHAD
ncbi:hypothetical protein OEZ85_007881 [Tetradesmus obliquus]|uniref:Derlin n=1 Tax=Tetradesmus obliquus TaxID=3088 RepID=A0ABY8TH92_TETOB|nr:hypothetical protein OEZ85_007881 [Tetradesmus obliquus]